MDSMSRVFRTLVVTFCAAAALAGGFAQAQSYDYARRIFELTNQDRQAMGLPELRWNAALAAAAEPHARRMATERALSHQYPGEPNLMDRAAAAGAHFEAIAENIATGPDPDRIEMEWMHSTPHRANILDPHMNSIGVAVVARGGYLYAVEDFAHASESLTPAQVEERIRALLRGQNIDPSGSSAAAEQACQMDRGMPQGLTARSVVRFETGDLSQVPSQVSQLIRTGNFQKAGVGACAPHGEQTDFTMYRVAVVFY